MTQRAYFFAEYEQRVATQQYYESCYASSFASEEEHTAVEHIYEEPELEGYTDDEFVADV